MSDKPMIGISVQIQGGGVDFHSAALLHDWMKENNEDDNWDLAPVLAVLFSDGDDDAGVILAQFQIDAAFEVKPWMVLREVAAASRKAVAEQKLPTTAVAASLFCEAWSYRVPADVMVAGIVSEDWKSRADTKRYETKTIMTLGVTEAEAFYSDRYRELTGWYDVPQVHMGGMVDVAMHELVDWLAKKNEGGTAS